MIQAMPARVAMVHSQSNLKGASVPTAPHMSAQVSNLSLTERNIRLPKGRGEETVNMAAVCFLRALSMRRPEATPEWEAYRKTFSLKLGETSIRAT